LNRVVFCGYLMSHWWTANIYHTLLDVSAWSEEEVVRLIQKLSIPDPRMSLSSFVNHLLHLTLFKRLPFLFYCFMDAAVKNHEAYSLKKEAITVNFWVDQCYKLACDRDSKNDEVEAWKTKFKEAERALELSRENFRGALKQANEFKVKFHDAVRRLRQKKKYFASKPEVGFNPGKELWLVAAKGTVLPDGYIHYKLTKSVPFSPLSTKLNTSPPKVVKSSSPY